MEDILHTISKSIGFIAALIAAYGIILTVLKFILSELKRREPDALQKTRYCLRQNLGYYLLLSLEFLIAADIIETLIQPSFKELAILGAITLIRTIVSFSLNWELAHEKKHTQH